MGKKKVLLFNNPVVREKFDKAEEGNTTPRIGVASIAAYLLSKGINVGVIDTQDIAKVRAELKEGDPGFVGIPAYTPEVYDSAYTAGIVRDVLPNAAIVVGGPHPSAMLRETLAEFTVFDIAVAGEGEFTMYEICSGQTLEGIKGIAYRGGGNEVIANCARPVVSNLDELPFPAWELYDMGKYTVAEDQSEGILSFKDKRKRVAVQVEAARGCPFDCIFCFRIAGRNLRYRTPGKVVDEIERNVKRYGRIKIYFVEGTFGVNKEKTMELCEGIKRRGLDKEIIWEASSRVDVIDEEALRKMKDAGCKNIGLGVESGDPEILMKIGKNTTPEEIMRAVRLCNRVGIPVGTTFILGHPYETDESIKRTIKFAKTLPVATANFAIMVPFPGTKVRDMAKEGIGGLRIKSSDWRYYGKQTGHAMDLVQIPYERLLKYQNRAYMEFYLRPGRLKHFFNHLTWDRAVFAVRRIAGLN